MAFGRNPTDRQDNIYHLDPDFELDLSLDYDPHSTETAELEPLHDFSATTGVLSQLECENPIQMQDYDVSPSFRQQMVNTPSEEEAGVALSSSPSDIGLPFPLHHTSLPATRTEQNANYHNFSPSQPHPVPQTPMLPIAESRHVPVQSSKYSSDKYDFEPIDMSPPNAPSLMSMARIVSPPKKAEAKMPPPATSFKIGASVIAVEMSSTGICGKGDTLYGNTLLEIIEITSAEPTTYLLRKPGGTHVSIAEGRLRKPRYNLGDRMQVRYGRMDVATGVRCRAGRDLEHQVVIRGPWAGHIAWIKYVDGVFWYKMDLQKMGMVQPLKHGQLRGVDAVPAFAEGIMEPVRDSSIVW